MLELCSLRHCKSIFLSHFICYTCVFNYIYVIDLMMVKRLFFWAILGISSHAHSQFVNTGHTVINDVVKPLKSSQINVRSASNPTPCDGDTSMFPSYGSTGYNTVAVRRGSALGQFYDAPQDMTISGFRFFALAITPTPARNVKIRLVCKLYKAGLDSLPSGAPIASDTLTVDTVQGANILLSRITRNAYFGKDIPINFPYIITVESDSTDVSAGVVSNSWANGDGKFRNLCVGSVSGIWYRCLNLNIGGTTFNSHMQFYPFVKYKLGTDFTIKQNCYPNLDTLHFPNHSPKNILSSIYYNRYVYSNIERFCHRWNFDYRQYSNSIDGAYKPQSKRNLRIELISTIYPYNGNFCRDTTVKTIYFNPNRPSLIEEPKACKGDDYKIPVLADLNAEVLWFHHPNDTGAFFKGRTLEINNAQNNDTFYVKAVNFNCQSIFLPVYFNVYEYPTVLTVKNDSICAGATANLVASTDKGEISWYLSSSLGKPFHTGNTYQTDKLTRDTSYFLIANNNGCEYAGGAQEIKAFVGSDFAPSLPTAPADTFICLQNQKSITLQAQANTQNDTLRWFSQSIGGSPIGIGQNYVLNASQRGRQSVYVESWNGICGSGRTSVNVYIKDFPQIFGATGATACENDTALLAASTPWGQLHWYTDKNNNKPFYTGKTPKVYNLKGTTYIYLKSAEDACFSPNFDSVAVIFNEIAQPSAVMATSVCARANGYMQVDVPFGTVNWYIDSLSSDILHTGSYYDLGIMLSNRERWYETENKGCKSERKPLTLVVKPRPVAGFTYNIGWQHRVSCIPIASTGLTLEWFWGDGTSKKGLPALHQYEKAGEYTIRLVATSNSNGCKDTVDIPVSVNHIGVQNFENSETIEVFPNPIEAGTSLQIKGVNQGKFILYNAIGKRIYECPFNEDLPIVLPEWISSGWFAIQVVTNDKTFGAKILVTH